MVGKRRAASAGGAREDLEVQAVHAPDGDGRQARGDGARADLAQHVVFGTEDALGPARQLGAALAEPFFCGRGRHVCSPM